jgi:hypothetical protein
MNFSFKINKPLLLITLLLAIGSGFKVEAATAALYSDAACTQPAGTPASGLPNNGDCFGIPGFLNIKSGKINCGSNNMATGSLFSDTNCALLVGTGSGVGDGATCIGIFQNTNPVAYAKLNCSSGWSIFQSSSSSSVIAIAISSFLVIWFNSYGFF